MVHVNDKFLAMRTVVFRPLVEGGHFQNRLNHPDSSQKLEQVQLPVDLVY